LNIKLSEEHVRRLLNGNGLDQVGLLQFISESRSTFDLREVLRVLSECSDILKNYNFEVFQWSLAKIPPLQLGKCLMGHHL
jgi:hypothetical protein